MSKTKLMCFGNWRGDMQIKVSLDGMDIEKVKEIRMLGVIMDDQISRKSQSNLQKKFQRALQY